MILGTPRVPFSRPAAASGSFQPGLPQTVRNSHFNPLANVMNPMPAASAWMPGFQSQMGPTPLPLVPAAAPQAPVIAPKAGGMAGAGFGATGGTPHQHVNPYMAMRMGVIPGVSPSGSNIRAGVRNAGARIQRSMPFQTAPLPPPPPPPPAPVTVPATGVKGLLGAMLGIAPSRRIRHKRRWWQTTASPQPVAQTVQTGGCETYGPRVDGIKVTVCNGSVVKYEDAQGNVRYTAAWYRQGPAPGAMAGSDDEMGWSPWRGLARRADPRRHLNPMRHFNPNPMRRF